MKTAEKKKHKKYLAVIAALWAFIVLMNLLAWFAKGVSDWYIDHITMIWVNTYSRLTSLAGFSVGEIMIVIGAVLVLALAVLAIVRIFARRKNGFKKFFRRYFRTVFAVATAVCVIMTLNCSMLYHASAIDPAPERESRRYTVEELKLLRNYIVEKCNEYSILFDRDESGGIIYDGDLQLKAKEAMWNISDKYPRLSGFYPDVKPLKSSVLMSQIDICGYYFPFSLEANYNTYMYILNYPHTYCHELSHLHGYIYEDEANFLSYLACTESDDDFFVYSGYISVLGYVYNAYWKYIDDWDAYALLPQTNELVDADNIFLTDEAWEEVNRLKIFDTKTVSTVNRTLSDASMKLGGVSDGFASYSRVVGLLLQYYDGILY